MKLAVRMNRTANYWGGNWVTGFLDMLGDGGYDCGECDGLRITNYELIIWDCKGLR